VATGNFNYRSWEGMQVSDRALASHKSRVGSPAPKKKKRKKERKKGSHHLCQTALLQTRERKEVRVSGWGMTTPKPST
jgi:hypothetical protein